VRRQYSNPNTSRRTLVTGRVPSVSELRSKFPVPAVEPPQIKLKPKRKYERLPPMKQLLALMPYVRRCRKRGHVPRKLTKRQMQAIIFFNLQ
jgi:hypothetical protein